MSKEQRTMSKKQSKYGLRNYMSPFTHCSLLIALLFVLCYLILACQNPYVPSFPVTIPVGKGALSLSIKMANTARTIMPSTPTESDCQYTLEFTRTTDSLEHNEERSYAQLSTPIYLYPGTYTLVVKAYLNDKLVAQGSIEVEIDEGESTAEEIELMTIFGTGQGDFIYTVTFPRGLQKAEMAVNRLNDTGTVINPNPVNLLTNATGVSPNPLTATGTHTLNSGYYNVVFTLEKNDGERLVWREWLHIYANLESIFIETFTDPDFNKMIYTVTFVLDNGSENAEKSVFHGETVDEPEAIPERAGSIFDGWYADIGWSTPFNFGTQITSDTNVYAKWIEIALPLKDVNHIVPYLAGRGSSSDNPVYLSFQLDLETMTSATSNWQQMLTKLNEASKFVDLDLEICTMSGGPEFNPDYTVSTGKNRIVSIILPTVATSITGNSLIDNAAFNYFTVLRSLSGTGLKTIGYSAFYDRTTLTQISLPVLEKIEGYAFSSCTGLTQITLPAGLTSIGSYAFNSCTSLTSLSLPASVSFTGNPFMKCTSLTFTVSGTGSLNTIEGGKALVRNTELVSYPTATGIITLPTGLTSIGESAFDSCVNLTQITLPTGITSIGESAFVSCNKLTQITLPAGLTSIGQFGLAFTGLTQIILPDELSSIGAYAFSACSGLTQITLPAELSSIGANAFDNCAGLTLVTSLKTTPPTAGTNIFNGVPLTDLRIEVPASSLAQYKAAAGWSTYESRIFAIATGNGTQNTPWLIYTKEDLQKVGKNTGGNGWSMNSYYKLMNNIDMAGVIDWVPIGTIFNSFTGNFDGDNKSISNLTINNPTDDYQGMFGYIEDGEVKNLTLSNCKVTGDEYVGGVVGINDNGTVKNCYTTGTVSGSFGVGGVVGCNGAPYTFGYGTVENCYSNCDVSGVVSGADGVGGVVGGNFGTVKNCYATGSISNTTDDELGGVGGVVGGNYYIVENCYTTGTVNGSNNVGGVVGGNYYIVENCYATGAVSGYDYVGGVVGANVGGTVKNCYATGDVSGYDYVGGVVGDNELSNSYAEGTVENCYATGLVSGHDFVGGVVGKNAAYNAVKNCVALNRQISYTELNNPDYGRVVGLDAGDLLNNYGRTNMTGGTWTATTTGIDGANVATTTVVSPTSSTWWTGTAGWPVAAWDIVNNSLPILRDMPSGTQNPQIQ